jgi:hypothetical protein
MLKLEATLSVAKSSRANQRSPCSMVLVKKVDGLFGLTYAGISVILHCYSSLLHFPGHKEGLGEVKFYVLSQCSSRGKQYSVETCFRRSGFNFRHPQCTKRACFTATSCLMRLGALEVWSMATPRGCRRRNRPHDNMRCR